MADVRNGLKTANNKIRYFLRDFLRIRLFNYIEKCKRIEKRSNSNMKATFGVFLTQNRTAHQKLLRHMEITIIFSLVVNSPLSRRER